MRFQKNEQLRSNTLEIQIGGPVRLFTLEELGIDQEKFLNYSKSMLQDWMYRFFLLFAFEHDIPEV